jgi:hypothetical protein
MRETRAQRLLRTRRCGRCGGHVPQGTGTFDGKDLVHRKDECRPLFGGGQGRSPAEVEENAKALAIVGIALVALLLLLLFLGRVTPQPDTISVQNMQEVK